jgi:hypothetical protein
VDDYSDLAGDNIPELVRGTMDLAALGGPGAELSIELILTWRNQLVFGLDPRAVALGEPGRSEILAFVGIGGHPEPGEGWYAAMLREAMEDAACPIALGDSPVTYLCRQGQVPQPMAFAWQEEFRPLIVWLATLQMVRPPRGALTTVKLVNAVFRAAALARPEPAAELPALLLLDHDTLLHTYIAPRPCAELLAHGARVIGRAPPPHALLAPGGTAYFFAQWLAWQA